MIIRIKIFNSSAVFCIVPFVGLSFIYIRNSERFISMIYLLSFLYIFKLTFLSSLPKLVCLRQIAFNTTLYFGLRCPIKSNGSCTCPIPIFYHFLFIHLGCWFVQILKHQLLLDLVKLIFYQMTVYLFEFWNIKFFQILQLVWLSS